MSNITIRDLSTADLAFNFLVGELGFRQEETGTSAAAQIVAAAESSLPSGDQSTSGNTLNERMKRVPKWRTNPKRLVLHNTIIRELFNLPRKVSDSEIRLGADGGGCCPEQLDFNKQAYIVIGPPASGKSSICEPIADNENALLVDSDYAKRKLPEYQQSGATVVHEESQIIIDGNPDLGYVDCLLDRALDQGANIVYPRVGRDLPDLMATIGRIQEYDYEIHLILAHCHPREATDRALRRYLDSPDRRYVPLSYIYDSVGELPLKNYHQLRIQDECKSFEAYDNTVAYGSPPKRINDWSDSCDPRISDCDECLSGEVVCNHINGISFSARKEDVHVPETIVRTREERVETK